MEGKSRAVCKFGPIPCALPPPGLWPAALGLPVAVPTAVPEHMCAEYVQADSSARAAEMLHESEWEPHRKTGWTQKTASHVQKLELTPAL